MLDLALAPSNSVALALVVADGLGVMPHAAYGSVNRHMSPHSLRLPKPPAPHEEPPGQPCRHRPASTCSHGHTSSHQNGRGDGVPVPVGNALRLAVLPDDDEPEKLTEGVTVELDEPEPVDDELPVPVAAAVPLGLDEAVPVALSVAVMDGVIEPVTLLEPVLEPVAMLELDAVELGVPATAVGVPLELEGAADCDAVGEPLAAELRHHTP